MFLSFTLKSAPYSAKMKVEFEKYLVAAAEVHTVHTVTLAHDTLCAQDAFL